MLKNLTKSDEKLLRIFIHNEKLDIKENTDVDTIIHDVKTYTMCAIGLFNKIVTKIINCDDDDYDSLNYYTDLLNIFD